MDVAYAMTSDARRSAAIQELARAGYQALPIKGTMAEPHRMRVRLVPMDQEADVVEIIHATDPLSKPCFPPPSFVTE